MLLKQRLLEDIMKEDWRSFFDFIEFEITDKEVESKWNKFAEKSKSNINWALSHKIRFLQYQKERVEKK